MASSTLASPESRGLVLVQKLNKHGKPIKVWTRPDDFGSKQLARIVGEKGSLVTPPAPSGINATFGATAPGQPIMSPWGEVGNVFEQAPGIYAFETKDGVYGFKLSDDRMDEIDERWGVRDDGWFSSESHDWAVVPFTFYNEFPVDMVSRATDTLIDYAPHEYMAVMDTNLDPSESVVLGTEQFNRENEGKFAFVATEDGVIDGETIVTAEVVTTDGSDGEVVMFAVPDEEIVDEDELPKGHRQVVDEERHPRTSSEIEALKAELKQAMVRAIVTRFPSSRFMFSTYAITKAAIKAINPKISEDDETENMSKEYGLRALLQRTTSAAMSQALVEIQNSKQYTPDPDAQQARMMRKMMRRNRNRRIVQWLLR
jgi:hypothetical protein